MVNLHQSSDDLKRNSHVVVESSPTKKKDSNKDDISKSSDDYKASSHRTRDQSSTKPISSSTLRSQQNMSLLNQMLSPKNNHLDEDAMILAIDKTSTKDSALREHYNQYYNNGKYLSNNRNNRRRRREVSSQSTSNIFAGGLTLSYPFYLSSSSSSYSFTSDEESESDQVNQKDLSATAENRKSQQNTNFGKREFPTNSNQKQKDSEFLTVTTIPNPSDFTTSKSDASSVDGNDTTKELVDKMKKRRIRSRRLTRGMARDRKYRKKEEKEKTDLMGLAALVLAAKEMEEEHKDDIDEKVKKKLLKNGKIVKRNERTRSSRRRTLPKTLEKPSKLISNQNPLPTHKKTNVSKRTRRLSSANHSNHSSPSKSRKQRKTEKLNLSPRVKSKRKLSQEDREDLEESERNLNSSNNSKSSPSKRKRTPNPANLKARSSMSFSNNSARPHKREVSIPTADIISSDDTETDSSQSDAVVRIIVNNELFQCYSSDCSLENETKKPGILLYKKRKKEICQPGSIKKNTASMSPFKKNKTDFPQKPAKKETRVFPIEHSPEKGQISRSHSSEIESPPKISSKQTYDNHDDPYAFALCSFLSQDNSVNQPMSLSLLDWRRRQQWIPMTPSSNTLIGDGMNGTDSALDFTTPTSIRKSSSTPLNSQTPVSPSDTDTAAASAMQVVHSNLSVKNQSSSMSDVPRRRHKTIDYANWCCQLVHYLSGSGRSNAHHEFFYSDIDRAWYNFNEFKVDIAKLGVHPDTRLTRNEWSLVRRRIRKRPRRFSKRFIASQLEKLERYRDCVRHIQFSDDPEAVPNFPYEVPAPIKIGAPVTAYNKKSRVLHRGIVLTRDPFEKRYMIQFERTELGCEFCPDTEVASHGVPETIRTCTERAVDESNLGGFSSVHTSIGSLPYGTTYGPLTDFLHKQEQTSSTQKKKKKKQGVARALDSELVKFNGSDVEDDINDENPTIYDSESIIIPTLSEETISAPVCKLNDSALERDITVERECLTKLMGTLDAMTERKSLILDALNSCYDSIELQQLVEERNNGDGLGNDHSKVDHAKFEDNCIEHHAWLHANLELTNKSLQATLLHLQVMYGKAYANRTYESERARLHQHGKSSHDQLGSNAAPWLETLTARCLDIGNSISGNIKELNEVILENGHKPQRLAYLENRFASLISLLLSTKLFKENYLNPRVSSVNIANSANSLLNANEQERKLVRSGYINRALTESLRRLAPPLLPWDHRSRFDDTRVKGYHELKEALSLFHAELAANRKEILV